MAAKRHLRAGAQALGEADASSSSCGRTPCGEIAPLE
jgi:hypothetical protein